MEHEENTSAGQFNTSSSSQKPEDFPVKRQCVEQREALAGEPRCVICGRYGEYICDETDDDICSTECKTTLLLRLAKSKKQVREVAKPVNMPVSDECFYVREGSFSMKGSHSGEVASLRNMLNISVRGEHVPDPIMCFSTCGLPVKLEDNLEAAGFAIPTPVQMQCIPAALNLRNLLVSSATGSGKTVSFLVPIIAYCSQKRSNHLHEEKRSLAIVLAPTRELCLQVEEQAKLLGKGLPFRTALVVGGDPLARQIYRVQHGVELIVGTPGRLIDLLSKHDLDLSEVAILVLDEVDCLLQSGFLDQVMQIFRALSRPQVLMFSATISSAVEKMANTLANNLIHVSLGAPCQPSKSVKQIPIWVESKHKKQKLFEILRSKQHFKPPCVVFVGSKVGADLLSEAISVSVGLKALSIHGDKSMAERRNNLKLFLAGEASIVVTTGVLGRGMDFLGVCQVIIFDMPNSMEEYVHQVGRASRMGADGEAFVFVNEEDKKLFGELVMFLKTAGAPVPKELSKFKYTICINSDSKKKRKIRG